MTQSGRQKMPADSENLRSVITYFKLPISESTNILKGFATNIAGNSSPTQNRKQHLTTNVYQPQPIKPIKHSQVKNCI